MGGMHRLCADSRRRIAYQRDMIPQLRCISAGALDAGIGDHADQDEPRDGFLLQQRIEFVFEKPLLP